MFDARAQLSVKKLPLCFCFHSMQKPSKRVKTQYFVCSTLSWVVEYMTPADSDLIEVVEGKGGDKKYW